MDIHGLNQKEHFDTNRQQGIQRVLVRNPPIFTPPDLKLSHNLLDLLASRLCPGKIFFDAASPLTSSHLIIPASPKRVALHFIGPNSGRVTISNETPVTIDNGFTFSATAGILSVDSKTIGDLVTREFYAIYAGGAGVTTNWSQFGAALSGATTGIKLSFTVPAGASATLTEATIANFTGAPTVALQIVRAATTFTLLTATAAASFAGQISLNAGDVVQWNVTTAVAASVFDATMSGLQISNFNTPTPVSWAEVYSPDNI